jgi:hypothetical protein
MRAVREHMAAQGWAEPIVMDSGNGYWLLYSIDLPNDGDAKKLVHGCLKALAAKFGDERVKIDTTLANASRIGKLPGTLACKGPNTPERPHRLAALMDLPTDLAPVPREKLEGLAGQLPQEKPAPRAEPVAAEPAPQQQEPAPEQEPAAAATPEAAKRVVEPADYASVEERVLRARAYVEKMDPAVSGDCGHDQTYHVAALLVIDFALPIPDALPILEEFNKRCKPPWTPAELERKLHEADKKPGPRGSKAGKSDPEKLHVAWKYAKSGRYTEARGMSKQVPDWRRSLHPEHCSADGGRRRRPRRAGAPCRPWTEATRQALSAQ